MTLRTLTFDPAQYKLVPIKASDMLEVANIEELDRYAALVAAVPDTLPGVVEHSGEPAGLLVETDHGPMYWPPADIAEASAFCDDDAEPVRLFTHPAPAQQVKRQELSIKQIEAGWHQTFSTSNPYCPCDLKSFTKAVQWTLAAITKDRGQA